MRADLVVVLPPRLDDRGCFSSRTKPLHVQALLAEAPVEALVGAVLPRLAGRDVRGLDALRRGPAQDRAGDKLGPVVGPEIARGASVAHEAGEQVDDSAGANAARDVDGQRLSGPFVDDGEALDLLARRRGIEHEVVRPDVVRARRWQRTRTTRGDSSTCPAT